MYRTVVSSPAVWCVSFRLIPRYCNMNDTWRHDIDIRRDQTTRHDTTRHYTILHYTALHHSILHHITPHHTITPHYTTSHHITPHPSRCIRRDNTEHQCGAILSHPAPCRVLRCVQCGCVMSFTSSHLVTLQAQWCNAMCHTVWCMAPRRTQQYETRPGEKRREETK